VTLPSQSVSGIADMHVRLPAHATPGLTFIGTGHAGAMQGGGTNEGHAIAPPAQTHVESSKLPGPQPADTATVHEALPQSHGSPIETMTGPGP
jgi:hypothetical protein